MSSLEKRIKMMAEYLDEEVIASTLHIPVETVKAILDGTAVVSEERKTSSLGDEYLSVTAIKTAYRQKIISVARAKGGVGATSVSLGLAYSIASELKTLLVVLNPYESAGDLVDYIGIDGFVLDYSSPVECSPFEDICRAREVKLLPFFEVLDLYGEEAKDPEVVSQLVETAKHNYDAVVIDLPNQLNEVFVQKAAALSNTVVAVVEGLESETARVLKFLYSFPQKDRFLVLNKQTKRAKNTSLIKEVVGVEIHVEKIEYDQSLPKCFERRELPSFKIPFMVAVKKLQNRIYGKDQKRTLKEIFF